MPKTDRVAGESVIDWLTATWRQVRNEPIAGFALIVAIGALWVAWKQVDINFPKLAFTRLMGYGGPVEFSQPKQERGRVSTTSMQVLNTGGRTATLTFLDCSTDQQILEAVLERGRPQLRKSFAYTGEVGVLTEKVPRDLNEMLAASRDVKFEIIDSPIPVNESIESGKSRVFAFVFRLRARTGQLVDDVPVGFSCDTKFSDGSEFKVFAGFSSGP